MLGHSEMPAGLLTGDSTQCPKVPLFDTLIISILSKHSHMLGFGPDMFCTGDAGYGPEEETCVFELTYNYGKDKYDNFKGEGYAQVALSSEVQ